MKFFKFKAIHSSNFGFQNNLTMVSYVSKKKIVILLSTMRHDKNVVKEKTKKPKIMLCYNSTKGGVDLVKRVVYNCTCKKAIKMIYGSLKQRTSRCYV